MSVRLFAADYDDDPRPFRQSEVHRLVSHPGIYAVRVWTPKEWAALSEEERPDTAVEHLNGIWTCMVLLNRMPA